VPLILADDSASDVASGGCCRAATEGVIPTHARTTVVADLGDQAIGFRQWREWRGSLRRCREGQGKRDSNQSDHFTSSSVTSRGTRRLIELGSDQTPEAHAFSRGCREGGRHQVPQRRLDGTTPTFDVADVQSTLVSSLTEEDSSPVGLFLGPCLARREGQRIPRAWSNSLCFVDAGRVAIAIACPVHGLLNVIDNCHDGGARIVGLV
jgi:hypothetical protein